MALNENSNDRNYLFGRLLAVCDRIEGQYYYREKSSVRQMQKVLVNVLTQTSTDAEA